MPDTLRLSTKAQMTTIMLVLAVFLVSFPVAAQQADAPSSNALIDPPATLYACQRLDTTVTCGTWQRSANSYLVTLTNHAPYDLTIDRWDQSRVEMHGNSEASRYVGELNPKDGSASGEFIRYSADHKKDQLGFWKVTLATSDQRDRDQTYPSDPLAPTSSLSEARAYQKHTCDLALQDGVKADPIQAWVDGSELMQDGHLDEALVLLCRSFAAGNAHAAFDIGAMYENGYRMAAATADHNARTDTTQAYLWYREAGLHRYSRAQALLAYYYINGPRVPGSLVKTNVAHGLAVDVDAGERGHDTEALTDLSAIYKTGWSNEGQTIAPNPTLSQHYAALADKYRRENKLLCAGNVALMRKLLPDRTITAVRLSEVRYDPDSEHYEAECVVTLAPEDDPSPFGGLANDWHFVLTVLGKSESSAVLAQRDSMYQAFMSFAEKSAASGVQHR